MVYLLTQEDRFYFRNQPRGETASRHSQQRHVQWAAHLKGRRQWFSRAGEGEQQGQANDGTRGRGSMHMLMKG